MSSQSSEIVVPVEVPRDEPVQGLWADLMVLTKARLSFMVVVTTFVGYCLASGSRLDWLELLHAVLGTTLSAASAGVLNQLMEANVDRLMERTRYRPLPMGRIKPAAALWLGVVLGVAGVVHLWINTNLLSAALALATILIYLFVYTPLKRKTALCTIAGAVAGALPPAIGWTAARPSMDVGAWMLFGVLFFWQMPHFLAIAWMYRDEYAQAGFHMLKRDDRTGSATALQSLFFSVLLFAVCFVPYTSGLVHGFYLLGAIPLNLAMLVCSVQFLMYRDRSSARRLFFCSIIFLPLLLGLMVLTHR